MRVTTDVLGSYKEIKPMHLTTVDYNGHPITFRDDGWFNATEAAKRFNKRLDHWLDNSETLEYIQALDATLTGKPSCISNTRKSGYLKTQRGQHGGGTWLHPKLAIAFARWLEANFGVWCDLQIDSIIRSRDEWAKQRHASASSSKLLHAMIKETRESAGKEIHAHHFTNEHRMINWLLAGAFTGLNRDGLAGWQLDFLAHFELRNSILLAREIEYEKRKVQLHEEAKSWILENAHRIASSNDPFHRIKA